MATDNAIKSTSETLHYGRAFASSVVKLARAENEEECDDAVGEATEALLHVFGRPMQTEEVMLFLELARESAAQGILTGMLLEGIENGIRSGTLKQEGEMISLVCGQNADS